MTLRKSAAIGTEWMARPITDRHDFTDAEAEVLSGVSVGTLRRLKATRAIESAQMLRAQGGYVRIWPQEQVYRAAIAADINHFTGWDYRDIGPLMAAIDDRTWNILVDQAQASSSLDNYLYDASKVLVASMPQDAHLIILNRMFVSLSYGSEKGSENDDRLLGVYDFGSKGYRSVDRKSWENLNIPDFDSASAESHFNLVFTIAKKYECSRLSINLGIPIRRVIRRRAGLSAMYPDEYASPLPHADDIKPSRRA